MFNQSREWFISARQERNQRRLITYVYSFFFKFTIINDDDNESSVVILKLVIFRSTSFYTWNKIYCWNKFDLLTDNTH